MVLGLKYNDIRNGGSDGGVNSGVVEGCGVAGGCGSVQYVW